MNFCVISPIAGLERYARLSKTHLVLAHLLHKAEYEQFYVNRRKAGDLVILNNGAYENTKPLDFAAYSNMIRRLDPQVVVLPDYLQSPWRVTASLSLKFLDEWANHFADRNFRLEYMFVPQCTPEEGLQGWRRALHTVLNDGRSGHFVKWVGLGRYLATEFDETTDSLYGFTRVQLAAEVKEQYPEVKLHALGMAAGSVEELQALTEVGVDSIDSSAPVWRGWNGYGLDNPDWAEHGTPCNFFVRSNGNVPDVYHNIILSNLEACGVATDK